MDKHFELGNDITFNPQKDFWSSLGPNDFTGSFDGKGYSIENVQMHRTGDTSKAGFFTRIGSDGVVKNLTITIYVITAEGGDDGGLASRNYGTISNCKVLKADNYVSFYSTVYVGGLVGTNFGTIEFCETNLDINIIGNAGGLVGRNGADGKIIRSVAFGNVTGTGNEIGGLVGENKGEVVNSYAWGDVSGESEVGGLVGRHIGNEGITADEIRYCYSIGAVSASVSHGGGLVGRVTGEGTVGDSYYNSETSGQNDTGKGVPKTTAEMQAKDPFSGWNYMSVWKQDMVGVNVYTYPYLQGVTTVEK